MLVQGGCLRPDHALRHPPLRSVGGGQLRAGLCRPEGLAQPLDICAACKCRHSLNAGGAGGGWWLAREASGYLQLTHCIVLVRQAPERPT